MRLGSSMISTSRASPLPQRKQPCPLVIKPDLDQTSRCEVGERVADVPIVHVQAALGAKVHLITSSGRTRIRFQPNGGNAGSNATFTLCDGRGASRATAFVMANSGNLHGATPKADAVSEACQGQG